MKSVVFALVLLVVLVNPVFAEENSYYIEVKMRSTNNDSEPDDFSTSKQWFTADKILIQQTAVQSLLVLMDKQEAYVLDHKKKNYMPMPISHLQMMNTLTAGNNEFFSEINISRTDQTKKIIKWNCYKVILKGKDFDGIAWMTDDIGIDREEISEMSKNMSSLALLTNLLQTSKEVTGFPVSIKAEMKIMNMQTITELQLVKFEKQDLPADFYKIPDNYKKVKSPFKN